MYEIKEVCHGNSNIVEEKLEIELKNFTLENDFTILKDCYRY